MASNDEKKRKRAAQKAERKTKKQKANPSEVKAPPCFVAAANSDTSTNSAPAGQGSAEASCPPSQGSTSSNAGNWQGPRDAAGSNSDLPSDDTAVNDASDKQQRPEQCRRARLTSDQVRQRQCQLKKILDTMEHDRKTQSSSKCIEEHHMKACLVNRIVNPFMDSHNALSYRLTFDCMKGIPVPESDDKESSESEDEGGSEDDEERAKREAEQCKCNLERRQKRELLYQSDELLWLIPDLKTDINILSEDQLVEYCRYLDYSIHSARQDDTRHLVDCAITYLSLFREGPRHDEAPSVIVKFRRGWHDYFTACQLCPFDMVEDFDADWEQFCDDVMNGKRVIAPGDFCSFLYSEDVAKDGGSTDAGLLRGPLFLTCYKSLWTGPSSAFLVSGRKARIPGKPPVAWKYKLFSVTPRSLAYTAVLALQIRHTLMMDDFAAMDPHGFNYEDMFNEILSLFKDERSLWCKETLAWWNSKVFTNAPHGNTGNTNIRRLTTAERIRKERKAATKGKKAVSS